MKQCLMLILAGLLGMVGASPRADAAQLMYAWANNPTASAYTANPAYAVNGGQPVRITRTRAGQYTVHFGPVSPPFSLQVSVYGDTTGHCTWDVWNTRTTVNVHCFDARGHAADRQFTVLIFKGEDADRHDAAYLQLDRADIHGAYTPSVNQMFPQRDFTVRSTSPGVYSARIGSYADGPIGLLASGMDPSDCSPLGHTRTDVMITCRDASGAPRGNSAFFLVLRRGTHLASFATSSFNGNAIGEGWSSDGSTQSVRHLGTGRYSVRIGPQASPGGYVQASSYFSSAFCHVVGWAGGSATIRCDRNGRPVDSAFTVTALKTGGVSREVRIPERTWSGLLQLVARGLHVHINNYDVTNTSPLTCFSGCPCSPHCPPAYRAMQRDGSYISYHSTVPGAGGDFRTTFTPESVWRNPFLFLLNDINLLPNRIRAHAVGHQVVIDLPFESNGREVATACHSDLRCGTGRADGNGKPNAEINNLVIHVPFRLSLDRSHGAPHIATPLGHATFTADIRRAGLCRNNAFAVFCDIFGGNIEGQIHDGIQAALDTFVSNSTPIQQTVNRGVNAAVCQLARARGQDCARLSELRIESNGDITLVF